MSKEKFKCTLRLTEKKAMGEKLELYFFKLHAGLKKLF